MEVVVFFYWLMAAVLFYAYFGYAFIIWVSTRDKKKRIVSEPDHWPRITCIIACYNEEKVILDKISNTLALDYPPDKMQVLIVNDGSIDGTDKIITTSERVKLITHAMRKGKAAALNTAMQMADTPIVIFSDANALLNKEALKFAVQHFNDLQVGGVAGEKKLSRVKGVGIAEGWYWRYESFLKKLDAAFYSVIGATGELFALRSSLYKSLDENIVLDDFYLSMQVCQQGYIIAYEPQAYATEQPSNHLNEEYHRKVRIAAGAFQSFQYISLKKLMRFPKLFLQVFSRRWLRWAACPLAIPLLLILNIIIVFNSNSFLYDFLLLAQLIFYSLAVVGAATSRKGNNAFFTLPFYFLFMNYCMLAGLFVFLKGEQTVFWNKAERVGV